MDKSVFKKIFPRTNITRMIFFVLSDIVFIVISIYLAFLLRFDSHIPGQYYPIIQKMIVLSLIFILPIFYFSKLYFFSWSYVSTSELVALAKGTTISFLFLGVALYISKDFPFFSGFPRSTLFISYFLVFFFCGSIRFAKRIYLQAFRDGISNGLGKKRTLIVGAGDTGERLLKSILTLKENLYMPVGFIDDNPIKSGMVIHGVKVLGKIDNIPEIVEREKVANIIISLPSAGPQVIKKAVEVGKKAGLKSEDIKIVPSLLELITKGLSLERIREVGVEDLLGRDPVSLDANLIESFIRNKKIMVTGAAGSIGSELCRQIANFKPSMLLILDQDETGIFNISEEIKDNFPNLSISYFVTDIQDKDKIEHIFEDFRPQVVFHAAAYKHVPLMEDNCDEAVKNNIFGLEIIIHASLKYNIERFIFISTDKAINPTSVMGTTKRIGEMICQVSNKKNHTKFISVRFGNVLGSRGSVIPIFKEQIKRGGPVEVTHPDMKRYFMITSEACLLVMQAGAMGQGGEVFVLDMGEPIKILDLAKEMIKFSGFEPETDIPIVFTGVRPGEKLFEEILSAEEGTIATKNKKIFIARLSDVDETKLGGGMGKLKNIIAGSDKDKIKAALRDMVPSYNPQEFGKDRIS